MFNGGLMYPLIWHRDRLPHDVILPATPRSERNVTQNTGLLARKLSERGVVCKKEQGTIIIGDNLPNTEWDKGSVEECINICKNLHNCYATHYDHSERKCNFLMNENNRLYYGGHTSAVCEVPRRAAIDNSTTIRPTSNASPNNTPNSTDNPSYYPGSNPRMGVDRFNDNNSINYGGGRGGNSSAPGYNNRRPTDTAGGSLSQLGNRGGGGTGGYSNTNYINGGYNQLPDRMEPGYNQNFMGADVLDPIDNFWNPYYNDILVLANDFPFDYNMFGDAGMNHVGLDLLNYGGYPYDNQYNHDGNNYPSRYEPLYGVDQSLDRLSYGAGGNDSIWPGNTNGGQTTNNNMEGPFEYLWRGASLHQAGGGGLNEQNNNSPLY